MMFPPSHIKKKLWEKGKKIIDGCLFELFQPNSKQSQDLIVAIQAWICLHSWRQCLQTSLKWWMMAVGAETMLEFKTPGRDDFIEDTCERKRHIRFQKKNSLRGLMGDWSWSAMSSGLSGSVDRENTRLVQYCTSVVLLSVPCDLWDWVVISKSGSFDWSWTLNHNLHKL